MPTHDTGVWIDDDGNVVYEQPKGRSTQLVAPGGEVSTAVRSRIEAYGLEDVDLPDEDKPADEPAATDDSGGDPEKTVTSEPAKPKRTRKSSK